MTKKFVRNSSKVWFVSDLHYCHEKDFILNPRGCKTVQEHKDLIVSTWNKSVSKDDTVFVLGDTVVGAKDKSVQEFNYLLETLNYSRLYMMPGNHAAGYKDFAKYNQDFLVPNTDKVVHFIPNYYEIVVDGQFIVLSHYPILSWNEMSHGSWMLYGHVHNNLIKTPWVRDNYMTGKNLDVSIESVGGPIEFETVKTLMNSKNILEIDHH